MKAFFGDLHTHCNISYAHGSLNEAIENAREQLDFVSITGHAHWPDMPQRDGKIDYIIDFHEKGFAKLKEHWHEVLEIEKKENDKGELLIFPGFEIHSSADGDRTIISKTFDKEIIYADTLQELYDSLDHENMISFPHHIGYQLGYRGINWSTFNQDIEPAVEIISMHGCSENSESTRYYLHSMGPSDFECSVVRGLDMGYVFGFIGGTDHHSACPGSYGHGATGVFADKLDADSIFEAIRSRHTWAITGDRIIPKFSCNGEVFGSVLDKATTERNFEFDIAAAGAIDSVDIIKNGKLFKRFSQIDFPEQPKDDHIRTMIYLEIGWGAKHEVTKWEVAAELSAGIITKLEPRFRGLEVVSPVEKTDNGINNYHVCSYEQINDNSFVFNAVSEGNRTNSTPTMQGICFYVDMPRDAKINLTLNGKKDCIPVARLIDGAYTGHLGLIDSPAYRLNRAPEENEYNWSGSFTDNDDSESYYYLRVRQRNDQWAWTSPIFFKNK